MNTTKFIATAIATTAMAGLVSLSYAQSNIGDTGKTTKPQSANETAGPSTNTQTAPSGSAPNTAGSMNRNNTGTMNNNMGAGTNSGSTSGTADTMRSDTMRSDTVRSDTNRSTRSGGMSTDSNMDNTGATGTSRGTRERTARADRG